MSEDPRSIGRSAAAVPLSDAEAAFAERAGTVLRSAETLSPGFEARVMRAVASVPSRGTSHRWISAAHWWTRSRRVTFSPLGGLALAAGFAGIVALGSLGVAGQLSVVGLRAASGANVASARTDTLHLVRFVFVDATASRVALAGDFNGWSPESRPLEASGVEGVWSVTVPLTPGRYEYAFVVDGERWVADPLARKVSDEFGGESSVVRVDGSALRVM